MPCEWTAATTPRDVRGIEIVAVSNDGGQRQHHKLVGLIGVTDSGFNSESRWRSQFTAALATPSPRWHYPVPATVALPAREKRRRMFRSRPWAPYTFLLSALLVMPVAATAQIGAAAERAAARAAVTAAERQAAERAAKAAATATSRRAATQAADRVIKRWSSSLCKSAAPCPLPAKMADTFKGGSYDEVILGSDTVLYRAFHDPKHRFGMAGERFSYWSRSDSRGVQAAVDNAIDVSRYGNTAERLVAVRVPRGTRVYEGQTQSIQRGPIGGGNQVVLDDVRPAWEVKP